MTVTRTVNNLGGVVGGVLGATAYTTTEHPVGFVTGTGTVLVEVAPITVL